MMKQSVSDRECNVNYNPDLSYHEMTNSILRGAALQLTGFVRGSATFFPRWT